MKARQKTNLLLPDSHWTNNNCESLNHVLKQKLDWRPKKLVELIEKLHEVVIQQFSEEKRAIFGMGEFYLDESFQKFCVSRDVWMAKSETWKKKYVRKLRKTTKETLVRTTDGQSSVQAPTHRGKKPGQRKRRRNTKTTTPSKSKRQKHNSSVDFE